MSGARALSSSELEVEITEAFLLRAARADEWASSGVETDDSTTGIQLVGGGKRAYYIT